MREFDLLQHVYAANVQLADSGRHVVIPPGDDMAMVELAGNRVLAAVDQLVAGRHFNIEQTPLHLVGRKAVTRSLSDIAAMAAQPVATLAAVTLPPDFGEDRAHALFDAMRETAAQYMCPLIGGDIAFHTDRSHPLVCAVTVFAEPTAYPPITRAGAQPGDAVYVTGALGGSVEQDGMGRHLTFEPRINEALELASILKDDLHAMIDISDGLGRDAMHIAEQSHVAIELDAERIPAAPGLDWRRVVSDGEDYELCFTLSKTAALPERIGAIAVTRIGHIAALAPGESPRCGVTDGGELIDVSELGWQHEA